MITFACVRTGQKYSWDYVAKLRNMIARHYCGPHNFICLTDDLSCDEPGIEFINIRRYGLQGWWAKMLLFSPEIRGMNQTIYVDLDTVVVGGLEPLASFETKRLAICENFTRLAGNQTWPCRYGSCVMVFEPEWGQEIFHTFMQHSIELTRKAGHLGDQAVIEALIPNATLLQSVLPKGFFLNKRDLIKFPKGPNPEASIVTFGGEQRPHNCEIPWIQHAWA